MNNEHQQLYNEAIAGVGVLEDELFHLRRTADELPAKTVNSLYQMILGMAIARYDFVTEGNTSTAKTIASDLNCLKLPITRGTVREWLNEIVAHLGVTTQSRFRSTTVHGSPNRERRGIRNRISVSETGFRALFHC